MLEYGDNLRHDVGVDILKHILYYLLHRRNGRVNGRLMTSAVFMIVANTFEKTFRKTGNLQTSINIALLHLDGLFSKRIIADAKSYAFSSLFYHIVNRCEDSEAILDDAYDYLVENDLYDDFVKLDDDIKE